MQINVHSFTLTTSYTATIKITGSDASLHNLPESVFKALGENEALDLTGFEWNTAAAVADEETTTITLHLNKA
jgi:hypothetical protein